MILRIPHWAPRLSLRFLPRHTDVSQQMIFESAKLAAASTQTNGADDEAQDTAAGRADNIAGAYIRQVGHNISFRDAIMGFIIALDIACGDCIMEMNVFEVNHHGL